MIIDNTEKYIDYICKNLVKLFYVGLLFQLTLFEPICTYLELILQFTKMSALYLVWHP